MCCFLSHECIDVLCSNTCIFLIFRPLNSSKPSGSISDESLNNCRRWILALCALLNLIVMIIPLKKLFYRVNQTYLETQKAINYKLNTCVKDYKCLCRASFLSKIIYKNTMARRSTLALILKFVHDSPIRIRWWVK